ncbi:hypothetical protein SAMN05216533_5912 [Streptomyces sp. Ag109_O5-10]|nr:hypothetical protein SAMN05216533_5912 [Streptomyces sp. Ag109_O5-10]
MTVREPARRVPRRLLPGAPGPFVPPAPPHLTSDSPLGKVSRASAATLRRRFPPIRPAAADRPASRGLLLVNRVADLVRFRREPAGAVTRRWFVC